MARKNTWHTFYQDRSFSYSNIALHWQYLAKIISTRPKKILEIGCGPADHSLFIKKIFPRCKIYLLDADEVIVKKIRKKSRGRFKRVYLGDVLNKEELDQLKIPFTDVVFSQGLMEHFNDRNFKKVIENFRYRTKRFIFSVPSNNYPVREFGNEILRSKEELDRILKKIGGIRYKISPYLDIGIRTKIYWLKINRCCLSQKIKYLFFQPNHFLVTIRYLVQS